MPTRNEDWAIGLSARVALMWCDELIVLLHACTDHTKDIALQVGAEHPGRVWLLEDPDSVWREMAQRQRMLEAARSCGATHIALVDADEVLTGNAVPFVRAAIEALQPGQYLPTSMYAMWRGIEQYRHDASVWSNRKDLVLAFRDAPTLCWQSPNGYDHHHRHPYGSSVARPWPARGGVMHLQFADWRRLVAKHALYKITERIRWPEKNVARIDWLYSQALNEEGLKTQPVDKDFWSGYQHLLNHLHLAETPWQEEECRRLVIEHGPEIFKGLNLFGLIEEGQCQAR